MSQRPISLSADLTQLRQDGYDIEIQGGHLLVKDVPYVTEERTVERAILISPLHLAGDVTQVPNDHTVRFTGSFPCDHEGNRLTKVVHDENRTAGVKGLMGIGFSQKPMGRSAQEYPAGYRDYHEKITTLVAILESHAQVIEPTATARTGRVADVEDDDGVFKYEDNASALAGISAVSERLAQDRVAIVGLGGSGSYVLDLLVKTPIREIHLFDGDVLSQHNAFRAPAAPSLDELRAKPNKVDHFAGLYGKMRHGLVPVAEYIDAENAELLQPMDFVFLCLDRNGSKKEIVQKLEAWGIPFIDVGMGVELAEAGLHGILRVTTSTPEKRDHVWEKKRIPFSEPGPGAEYASNIQIADLNALNATLAVIKWKKWRGFYADFEKEHFSAYTIDGNHLLNEDQA